MTNQLDVVQTVGKHGLCLLQFGWSDALGPATRGQVVHASRTVRFEYQMSFKYRLWLHSSHASELLEHSTMVAGRHLREEQKFMHPEVVIIQIERLTGDERK